MVKNQKLSEKELKHQARRYSIKEGMFAAASGSFGAKYVSPFAIAINSSNAMVALLTAISGLLGPLTQIFGSRLIEKYPRKKICRKAVFFEALMWLPLIAIAFLFYYGILESLLPLSLLIFFSFYVISGNTCSPSWFSWMGDIVDQKYRGRWYSKRAFITGTISIILALAASFLLNYFKQQNWTMFGFVILFSLAFLFRMACWRIFKKQYEPKLNLKKGYYFSFFDFLIKAPKTNFGKFAIFRAILSFSTNISASLLSIYLLRNLGFGYITYMVVILSSSVFSLVLMNLWGILTDKYGAYRILAFTSLFIPLVPILWVLSPSPVYMVFVPSLISGISWAGFDLAQRKFVYDNLSKQKVGLAVSYQRVLEGIGVFFGAGLGAILIKYLTISFIQPIILIYLIGGIVRMIVVFWWIPKLNEIKKARKFGTPKSFRHVLFSQIKPALREEAHEIMAIREYLQEK